MIAIYSKNREEWSISDLSCALTGITTVPLYDTNGIDSIEYILDQTRIKTVFCSSNKVGALLQLKAQEKINNLTHIIYFEEVNEED